MAYRIIDAKLKHVEQIELLERQCFSLPWTVEQLKAQLPDEMHQFLAAEDENGQVLGYVGMMNVLDEGYISNVAVSPEHRRQGIADALIGSLADRALELCLSFLTLEVRQSNQPAIRLYSKQGFIEMGIRKKYYQLPEEDAIIMTKFLKRGANT